MKMSNAMSSTAACSSSQPILSGDVIIVDDIPEPPSSKRKLNFGNEPDAYQVNSQDTSDIMAKSTSEAELGMDFIEKAFQEDTIKVLMGATEGLNTDTLRDPQCCARLEDVSARLPSLVPGVVKAKELLLQLISISQQLQLAHVEFESCSAQKRKELDEAQRELAIHEATSENQKKEEILEEKAQFAHRPSEREANGKKWNEAIVEAAAGVEQAASNLQVKVTSCEQNVDDLIKSLKTWSAISN
ncbi:hypothetical protein GUJ93_ZPchr0002g25762 [Zizania palustris]|uniref:Uncharacterized protein n=1 Tax=Zizania palustris TaxID=103762 RepID=A0A8J5VWM7_ZIZPA|nr:hypothetical protein GUJ93_ZPchr0002g25762 [Zizania palustris]